MKSVDEIVSVLKENARPDQLKGMAKFGMTSTKRLGISIPVLRKMAKEISKNHNLALQLWKTGFQEARILAGMIDKPEEVSEQQMEEWVIECDSWDVCDQVCMNLWDKVSFVNRKTFEWSNRREEFVKRAAFALIACVAWHDKNSPDENFIKYFPLINRESIDERNYVKKAVNWALRHIGKRNINLNRIAIKTAKEIRQIESKSARWIARDAIRELESDSVQKRLIS